MEYRSWMIVQQDGERKPVFIKPLTRLGVRRAVAKAVKAGVAVTAAYLGGAHAIALSPKVYP
jgi:hypothetical protein